MSEFQIGDRVVVLDNYPVSGSAGDEEIARRGKVGTVEGFGSLYLRVTLDGEIGVHLFTKDELVLAPSFNEGDEVLITDAKHAHEFVGLSARVMGPGCCPNEVRLEPLTPRPDGNGFTSFNWDPAHLALIAPVEPVATEPASGPVEFAKAMREQADAIDAQADELCKSANEAYAAADGLRALATFTLTVAGIRD